MARILITYGGSVEHEFEVEFVEVDGIDVEEIDVVIGRLSKDEE